MEKSVLKHTGWLMLIVLAVLLLLNLLPGGTIGGYVLRRVDILGDVRPVPEVVSEPDSLLPPPPKVKPAFVDTCRSGMTCIEDYSDSTLRGMTPFYRALDELAAKPRPVRIAYFGDSFIEADILTADLRAMLQERYGGCGVGFVTITSRCGTALAAGRAIPLRTPYSSTVANKVFRAIILFRLPERT